MATPPKILFLLPYPIGRAPSQRFRVEAYFPLLTQQGYRFAVRTFFDRAAWDVLYQKGALAQKGWALFKGFLHRLFTVLFVAPGYDIIFIHREAAPLGPPVFEWALAKLFRKRIIYDFDDAIWIPNTTAVNRIVSSVKCFGKIKWLCRWAHKVSVGNDYLASFAKQHNPVVVVNPTCVDMELRYRQSKEQNTQEIVIGWTGSHSTIKYLDEVYPVLEELSQTLRFRFLVICDKAPAVATSFTEYRKWSEATEIDDLLRINIGIMPLQKDAWSEGKCGFKLIQYLSLGIPAVASPVGVNSSIIEQGKNGFLCSSPAEWKAALTELVMNEALREKMGMEGRRKMRQHFSVQSNQQNFLSLFSGDGF